MNRIVNFDKLHGTWCEVRGRRWDIAVLPEDGNDYSHWFTMVERYSNPYNGRLHHITAYLYLDDAPRLEFYTANGKLFYTKVITPEDYSSGQEFFSMLARTISLLTKRDTI
jgi:hypothetical protein